MSNSGSMIHKYDANHHDFSFLSRMKAILMTLVAYLLLRVFSIEKIAKFLKFSKRICTYETSFLDASRLCQIVKFSDKFIPFRIACLEHSLAVALIAITERKEITWCLGVKNKPFTAHAWIELNGYPVEESSFIQIEFKKILSI
jgi:hypothetical protein